MGVVTGPYGLPCCASCRPATATARCVGLLGAAHTPEGQAAIAALVAQPVIPADFDLAPADFDGSEWWELT